jgi:hypothetical protein
MGEWYCSSVSSSMGPSPKRPMQEELSLLDERFRKSGNTPVMATIKKLLAEHIASLYA